LLAVSGIVIGILIEIGIVPVFEEPAQNIILQTAIQSGAALIFFLAVTLFARRQIFRDPNVALSWFAKIWKQSLIVQTVKPQQHLKPQETKPASSATAAPETLSTVTRPFVQKPSESVPFKSTEKDDGFDLTKIA